MRQSFCKVVQHELFHAIQPTACLRSCRSDLQKTFLIEHLSNEAKVQTFFFSSLARVRDSTGGQFRYDAKRFLLIPSNQYISEKSVPLHQRDEKQTLEIIVLVF